MTDPVDAGSFRDPSGFVFRRAGTLFRQVNLVHREHFELFLSSGLYATLVEDGLLVPHDDVGPGAAAAPGALTVIRPEPVEIISYPYEWCFSQLKDAAQATLRIQKRAMEFGMSLRDASAYNIQFHRGRPVLIDTLSFEMAREGAPWVAYGQFCKHFLAPLALAAYVDVRLIQLARIHIDGLPLDLASRLLPRKTRRRLGLQMHIHLHARAQKRYEGDAAPGKAGGKTRTMSRRGLAGLVDNLEATVRRLSWEPPKSVWTEYYGEADHYSHEAHERKRDLVAKLVEEAAPRTVWDLGANTGMLSRIAAERGASVASWEMDPGCVEASYREVVQKGETNILPLVLDLANPSPAIGWESRERASLEERGPADLVLALALVHHLAIGNNVPLPRLAAYLRRLGRALLIEWVPKDDPKVQTLLASREDVFPTYTRDEFERAFGAVFEIERAEPLPGSGRVLYLMR